MDFSYTVKEEAYRRELRTWLENNLPDGWLEGKRDLPENDKDIEVFLRDWHTRLYEGGWIGTSWPKEYGGQDASLIEQVIFEEELSRVEAPPLLQNLGLHMMGPTFIHLGTDEQRKKYLHKIMTGEEIWCQGYSEPNTGSDLASLQLRAERKGDKYILNGQKIWTSYAQFADRCFLLARTTKGEKKHHGITVFLVNMRQPGIEVRPINEINGESRFNEVYFENAEVGVEDIVGEVDQGWKVALLLLNFERVGVAKLAFTIKNTLNSLVELTKTLKKNGRPLIEDPIVRQKLADFYTRAQAGYTTYYRNLTTQLQTGKPGNEGSIIKLFTTELDKEMGNYATGLLADGTVSSEQLDKLREKWDHKWLSTFGLTIAGGSSEIQRNVIGEQLLGLPRDIKK